MKEWRKKYYNSSIEVKTKICSKCGIEKDINEFPHDSYSKDNHHHYCKQCNSEYKKSKYNADLKREQRKRLLARHPGYDVLNYQNHHLMCIIQKCLSRGKKRKMQCSSRFELYDYLKPIYDNAKCECCGKQLVCNRAGRNDNSFSIDRIDNTRGYAIGNVAILCDECNRIKSSGTWQQHETIANWIKSKLKIDDSAKTETIVENVINE